MISSPSTSSPNLITQTLQEWKALALLGGPIMVAQLAQMANGVVDTMMAGHASARDLAAVGIGTGIWGPVLLFFIGVLSALQPLVSGHRGAENHSRIMPITWQGLYIACVGAICMAIILTHVRPIFVLLGLDAQTTDIAQGYLDALAWGIPAVLLLNALRGLTDGMGHTQIIMVFFLISTILNVPFNYLFIFGFSIGDWQFPALGGVGCGWATTASNWIAAIALLFYLNLNKDYKNFHLIGDWAKPDWLEIKHILTLGLPIGFAMFVEVSMFCMIALFLSPLGPNVIAGHQVVLNAISLFFMVPLSLGMALTLRVSFLIGAEEHFKARLLARSAIFLALGISCINAPILFFGRDLISSLYTNEVEVQVIAAQLFALGAIFQIADVTQVTMINVLRGYKDTKIPMFIMLFSFWCVCLPLGYVLTFTDWLHEPMGAAGFWTALIVGLACAAALLTTRVLRYKPAQAND
ncbi:MATE family efflux transporter [Cellvibrio zantedeschiae]|uniref:MATE family efflux transporter n=1 Tax=Cellvibrio zantedeschiae TaxID=1237077 RepID=UPI001E51A13B|nr:MATE family efflux transporter [Cellvibrio zantedeschiae]